MKIEILINQIDAVFTLCREKRIQCNFIENTSIEYDFKQYRADQLSYEFNEKTQEYFIYWQYENHYKISILTNIPFDIENETVLKDYLIEQIRFYKNKNAKIQDFIIELFL